MGSKTPRKLLPDRISLAGHSVSAACERTPTHTHTHTQATAATAPQALSEHRHVQEGDGTALVLLLEGCEDWDDQWMIQPAEKETGLHS